MPTPESNARFEAGLADILQNFNYSRIISAVRATKFGWAAIAPPDAAPSWYEGECRRLIAQVARSAYQEVELYGSTHWYCECGGFRAVAYPDGALEVQFILFAWDNYSDEDADEDEFVRHSVRGRAGLTTIRRRILTPTPHTET